MRIWISAALLLTSAAVANAQTPYAGMQTRPIKALSEQQMADLSAGRGMGLALAAELNGYPGPSHVLELADRLELSADQRASIQRLFPCRARDSRTALITTWSRPRNAVVAGYAHCYVESNSNFR